MPFIRLTGVERIENHMVLPCLSGRVVSTENTCGTGAKQSQCDRGMLHDIVKMDKNGMLRKTSLHIWDSLVLLSFQEQLQLK